MRKDAMTEEMVVSVFEARAVELKPGHQYLLFLRGDNISDLYVQRLSDELKRLEFTSLVIAVPSDVEVVVIEAPPVEVPPVKDAKPKGA